MTLRHSDSRGQVLPLFVLSSVALLALMGLGLDGARAFVERRQAQGAADLAALAGARFLVDPFGATEQDLAEAEALDIAEANGYTSGVVVTFPEDNRIRVTINSGIDMLFMPVLGMNDMDVGATATAMHEEEVVATGGSGPAIFAIEDDCINEDKIIDWSGSHVSVTGDWHTNGDVDISGDMEEDAEGNVNTILGAHDYVCVFSQSHPTNPWDDPDVPGLPNPWDIGVVEPDPVDLKATDFHCDYGKPGVASGGPPYYPGWFAVDFNVGSNGGHWEYGGPNKKDANNQPLPNLLKSGTFCGKKVSLSVPAPIGHVTFAASQQVSVSSGGMSLTGYEHNVLFVTMGEYGQDEDFDPQKTPIGNNIDGCGDGNPAITVSGSNGGWDGIIYAPCGRAAVSGSGNFVLEGAIVANKVKVSGSDWAFNAAYTGGPNTESLPEVLALVE